MKELKNARIWSNKEMKKIAEIFEGDIINISGEFDNDKQGGVYRGYFVNAQAYRISNYKLLGLENEIELDLEKELPISYKKKYNVVFNHTVLEHIYDIRTAFRNLCGLAKEAVIIVVPFVQEVHYKDGVYYDYWRPTPFAIRRMFEENGFTMLYYSCNNMDYTNTYLFCVGIADEFVNKYHMIDNRPHDYYAGKWVQKYGSEWKKNERFKRKVRFFLKSLKRKQKI